MNSAQLNETIAEKFFGWKWMAFIDRPMRSHPDYPKDVRVRRFVTPNTLADKSWISFFSDHDGRTATGYEPLAYCYCSSGGPAVVPNYSGGESAALELEREIRGRGLWNQYTDELWNRVSRSRVKDAAAERLTGPTCRDRCLAALAVVDKT